MTEVELQKFAKFLYKKLYSEELVIPVKINARLRRTYGWFCYDESKNTNNCKVEGCKIEISKRIAEQNNYIVGNILAHELTHFYLFIHDQPFDDKDPEFIYLLNKNGISQTNEYAYIDGQIMEAYDKREIHCCCGYDIFYEIPSRKKIEAICTCPNCKTRMQNDRFIKTLWKPVERKDTVINRLVDIYETTNKSQ